MLGTVAKVWLNTPLGVVPPSLNLAAWVPSVTGTLGDAVSMITLPTAFHPVKPDSKLPLVISGAAEGVGVGVGEAVGVGVEVGVGTGVGTGLAVGVGVGVAVDVGVAVGVDVGVGVGVGVSCGPASDAK